jgi:predicted AAA+ superfamily ATPase
MKLVIQKLYKDKTISKENIFYINKEFMAFDHINSYQDLKGAFSVFLKQKNKGKIFVGIDEIQEVS